MSGVRTEVTYALTDRELAGVYYRHRRRSRWPLVRQGLVIAAGLVLIFWIAPGFPPAKALPWRIVGAALIAAAVLIIAWTPHAVRQATLRNVRDNPALLNAVSLAFDDDGIQPPHGLPNVSMPWAQWPGRFSEDAAWFYLHLPGVRAPWPVPKRDLGPAETERFARLAGLRGS